MSEEIYIDKRKEFVVNRYCSRNGAQMYQITIGMNYIQLDKKELKKMLFILSKLLKNE